jgi:RimJ/RimL family protein N-acetyltransferase
MREAIPFPAHFLPQQTERLTLRRFTEVDLDRFLAYRHDPVVARFQSWSMLSEDEAIAFIHEMSTALIGIPGEWFQIAIALQQSNRLIGDIGIQVSEHDTTTVEIGFTLHREEQGKGYAREAVQALLHSLFELGNITKVIGITDSRNYPSIHLMTQLAMNLISSEEVVFRNELCVEQTFELRKKDWLLHTVN